MMIKLRRGKTSQIGNDVILIAVRRRALAYLRWVLMQFENTLRGKRVSIPVGRLAGIQALLEKLKKSQLCELESHLKAEF